MSNDALPFIMQGRNIVLIVDGQSVNVTEGAHKNYEKIRDALKEQDWESIRKLLDQNKRYVNYSEGRVKIVDGEFFYDDTPLANALTKRFMDMYEEGFPVDSLKNFLDKVMTNPSFRAVQELYGFLEKNDLPLTPDGNFMAYKRVKRNEQGGLVDCHTGKNCNEVGSVVTMPRNQVNDNPRDTCSEGLHFASLEYVQGFHSGSPIVLLEIDPADVVSIPVDYNNQKGRCCKYKVISLHDKGDDEETYDSPVFDPSEVAPNDFSDDDDVTHITVDD